MHIRAMTEKDFDVVRIIWTKSGIELSASDDPEELLRMITRNPKYCFVLEHEEYESTLIGAVLGGFDGRRGWIHHLAVLPEYQKKGYGKMLLNKVITAFENDKIVKIKLEVLESNKKVLDFYERQGWDLRPEITTMSMNLPRKA